jgi:hypothetical protein
VLAPPYEQVRIAELQVFGPIVKATAR